VIVILDNRDSFVLNVQHRLWEIGVDSVVVPSHATRLDEIADRQPAGIIVSPGPQGPDEAGISTAAIRVFGARMPVLGICLGHQCIAVAHGVPVAPNANACHGRASPIAHDGRGVLERLPSPFDAGRYHALAAAEPGPAAPLEVSARLADGSGLIMGLRHRTLPIEGVQFHPESILTPLGFEILANFARQAGLQPHPPASAGLSRAR
jgi:anthranilate synthase/aminodeoxychorismate synthase-like glutamine amidotransferase